MKRLKQTMFAIMSLLSLSEIPIADGKVAFSEEEEGKLNKHFGEKLTERAIKAMNKEIESIEQAQASKDAIEEMEQELEAVLKENGTSMEEALKLHANDQKATTEGDKKIVSLVESLVEQNKSFQATINKLIKEPDDDAGEVILNKTGDMKAIHNGTHLFGDNKAYNDIKRSWNKNAVLAMEGKDWKPTDFMAAEGVEVQKLNQDLDHYYREDPTRINSLHRDNIGLPSFWGVRTDVDDRVADGNIVSAEITQPRKLPWLPKNKQLIQPEERRIFPVSIDIEFSGHALQKLEQNWMNRIVQGGSQPYKIPFVQYLVMELDKKARNEDRMAGVKGIHVATPDNATEAGKAINRGDGLLYQLWKGIYVDGKIKVPNLPAPTFENIVDHIEEDVKLNLKEEIKENTNLVRYMPPEHIRMYKSRIKLIQGGNTLFQESDMTTIENYPNIRMEPLVDLAGTNLHITTFDDNIEILEKIAREKSMYTFERQKRQIFVLADYKFNVAFKHLGMKVKDGDPDAFKVQSVWTNGQNPFPESFSIPVYDNGTGEVDVKYSNLHLTDGWNTDITKFNNVYPGQVIKLRGNANNATKNVLASSDHITLAGAANFDLSTGGTLTLLVNSDFTVTEIKRTTEAANTTPEDAEFSSDTVDVTTGLNQIFNGGTVTLASIENGVEGQKLTITRGDAGALTINDVAGNIEVASTALLDAANDTIEFVLVDGVWTETSRILVFAG